MLFDINDAQMCRSYSGLGHIFLYEYCNIKIYAAQKSFVYKSLQMCMTNYLLQPNYAIDNSIKEFHTNFQNIDLY